VWSTDDAPQYVGGQTLPRELGVQVQSSDPGYVIGVRFYKEDTASTHIVNFWDASGDLLATGSTTGESPNGWQTAYFANAVPVAANTPYVASYFLPTGAYPFDNGTFDSAVTDPPLEATASAYAYGDTSSYPSYSYLSQNYWVDILFSDTAPAPQCTPSDPCSLWLSSARPTGSDVGGPEELGVKLQSTQAGYITGIRFYKEDDAPTHTVDLWDPSNDSLLATTTTGFETSSGWQTASFLNPVPIAANTPYVASYYLPGGAFAVDSGAFSTGYGNVPLQVPADGGVYGTGSVPTFPTIGGNGSNYWVDVTFSTSMPPPIPSCTPAPCSVWSASTTPETSYPTIGAGTFGMQFQSSEAGYISGLRFYKEDTNASHALILWDAAGNRLATGYTSNETTGWQTAVFAQPVPIVANTTYVASYFEHGGATAWDSPGLVAPIHSPPLVVLPGGVYVQGDAPTFPSVISVAPYLENFWVDVLFTTTAPAPECTASEPCSIWGPSATPAASDSTSSVELGVKLKSQEAGYITGIRFYKEDAAPTHTVNFWDASGRLLATASTGSETSSGWQMASFAAPVHIDPDTTYVASYFMPGGTFALDRPGFSSAVSNPPLEALANSPSDQNGVYSYGSTSTFPTSSFSASNYWVDVFFSTTIPPPVRGCTPAAPCSVWPDNPTATQWNYNYWAIEPGNKVQSSEDGYITGIRFYKQDSDPVHTVDLWDLSGDHLASTTTLGETSVGWQTAKFAKAVPIKAYATYLASVFLPSSIDAYDYPGLQNAVINPPLVVLADGENGGNGLYSVGAAPSFPTAGAGSAVNYWTDVLFSTTAPPASRCTPSEPCSVWFPSAKPVSSQTMNSVEVGVKVKSSEPGYVTGIRFYKEDSNPSHIVNLWDAMGNHLATGATGSEMPSGWQTAWFPKPVRIAANTTYVASYFMPSTDNVGVDSTGLTNAVNNPPLTALADGVFSYGDTSSFPTSTLAGSNYWVDLLFSETEPPPIRACTPSAPCSLWPPSAGPPLSSPAGAPVELGIKVQSIEAGYITGVRFFKEDADASHPVSLWDAAGNQLATGTTTNETASGWQTVRFSQAVPVAANTTYVASYSMSGGGAPYDYAGFAAAFVNLPLQAVASGSSAGPNAVIGQPGTCPTSPTPANYWVDVLFSTEATSVCGDGVRDPGTEECDDGLGTSTVRRACSAQCQVLDELAVAQTAGDGGLSPAPHTLAAGRHPLAVSDTTFAAAYLEPNSSPLALSLATFGQLGEATGVVNTFSAQSTVVDQSNPVLAGLPLDMYAAAWADNGGDGDELGVALRLVNPSVVSTTAPAFANVTTAFSQYDPDIVWTGSQVVVAWVDDSNAETAPDLRFRTFDQNLNPTSGEQTLAATADSEADVALTGFQDAWAAAWRDDASGVETVQVQTAHGVTWSVGPFLPPADGVKPALAAIDGTHLLLTYAVGVDSTGSGVANGSVIQVVALDTAAAGNVSGGTPVTAMVSPAAGLDQSWPNVASVGGSLFLSWWTAGALGDPNGEQLWLKAVGWQAGTGLDLTATEMTLPRWAQANGGDQRYPALVGDPNVAGGAVVAGWDDLGRGISTGEGTEDVVVEMIPVPVLRMAGTGGGP
jgi:hypothetical protein